MKRLISPVSLLFNIQLVHLFSNTFETARYNMIIHVIVFLVSLTPTSLRVRPQILSKFLINIYAIELKEKKKSEQSR